MTELEKLAQEIRDLSPQETLRLAADLLDRNGPIETIATIVSRVSDELNAVVVLRKDWKR